MVRFLSTINPVRQGGLGMDMQSTAHEKLADLGYANGWGGKAPDIVRACRASKHSCKATDLGRCLTEWRCEICGYKYKVDSSG